MNNKEKLDTFKMVYGKDLMCTDGLFHIYDKDHSEIYINPETGEVDNRGKYSTLIVYDKIIISAVLNSKDVKYVVLSKKDLKCLYKSNNQMSHVDDFLTVDILVDKHGNHKMNIISHTGKILVQVEAKEICNITDNIYLVRSDKSFNDLLIQYNQVRDCITKLTDKNKYLIYKNQSLNSTVDIISMQGGRYQYDFKNNQCINQFTGEAEEIQIWNLA